MERNILNEFWLNVAYSGGTSSKEMLKVICSRNGHLHKAFLFQIEFYKWVCAFVCFFCLK